MKRIYVLSFIVAFLSSCDKEAGNIVYKNIEIPTAQGAESNLYHAQSGDVYFSWIEHTNDSTDRLNVGRIDEGTLVQIEEINAGSDWFVNWADFPAVSSFENGQLIAHWLAKSAKGVYDYDINMSIKTQREWMTPFILHNDNVPAEHGFVSYLPLENGQMMCVWLDGRLTKGGEGGHNHNAAMMLRSAMLSSSGEIVEDVMIDQMTCECCQTDLALSNLGPIVVYRDKSEENIRDIFYSIKQDSNWSIPKSLYPDNWLFSSCPVNGPAIAANNENVLVAWYSGSADSAEVKLIYSADGGLNFEEPIFISDEKPLGRVDVLNIDKNNFLISWMGSRIGDNAMLTLSKFNIQTKQLIHYEVEELSSLRSSGFPRISQDDQQIYVTWTAVGNTLSPKLVQINKEIFGFTY